jgi:amino acid adenylation domain-containing protein
MGEAMAVDYGDRRLQYRELEEMSNNLANFLIASGAAKGSIVAIIVEDSVEAIIAIIATLKAGCVFVPLDPNLPETRLASMVAEVSPKWFIVESKFFNRIPMASGAGVVCVDSGDVTDNSRGDLIYLKEYAGYRNIENPDLPCQPNDMCYIYFTSGSTGRPKGIAGRLMAIDHFVNWEIETFGVGEGTRVSQLTTPSFDAYLRDVFVPLCAGGVVCGPKSVRTSPDLESLIDWVDRRRINLIHCVPSLFRSILSLELKPTYFSALKNVLLAGEPVLPSDVRKWTEIFGDRIQLVNLYGPSETTMTKLFYPIKSSDRDRRSIPIGKPMPGAKAMIIGSHGKACLPGGVGEIYIRTPFRSLGYYNRPELTNEAFIPNPFTGDPDDLIYKTGDLGRVLKDGNFEFLGRKDQQVKIRGIRVELREIENLLLDHEIVKEVAVIDRDDESGNKYLCAYVVCAGEAETTTLRDFLAARLPEYMVPSMFVMMKSLPRTITGKIDRRALPSIEQARAVAGRPYIAPRTPVEEVLAVIWSQVLRLERLGVDENFFELGGHSLLATQVISRVKAAFEVELPLRALFESPTVGSLAEQVESALREGSQLKAPAVRRVDRSGSLPLSYAQQRLWFIHQLRQFGAGGALYNVPVAVRLIGELNVAAAGQSIREIVRRHESLRTRFPMDAELGQARQVVGDVDVELELIDLSGLGEMERAEWWKRLAEEEAERGFDLSLGPVIRAKLVRVAREEWVMMVTVHHIATDGWSSGILVREFGRLYEAYAGGAEPGLGELPIQYVDYAVWQREWLKGEALRRQLDYWEGQLAGAPPLLELPTDRVRPAAQSFRGASLEFEFDEELSEGLRRESRRAGVTIFMTLLGAYQTLLHRYSGQAEILVGTPIAGRTRAELEGLIGFFVNTLVLKGDFRGGPSFREVMRKVRETALAAYAHQDVPFERVVEELQPERSLSYSPIFQVMFVYQNTPESEARLEGIELRREGGESNTTKFDLMLNLEEKGGRVAGTIEYSTDLFEEHAAHRMIRHFEGLVKALVEDPGQRVSEAQLLGERERRQLLVEWNETSREYPGQISIHEMIDRQAELRPDAIAMVFDGQEVSYGQLDSRSNQLARLLREQGVRSESRVGICVERSVEMVVSMLAVIKASGVYVPLDPGYPGQRLYYMLEDSGAQVVITQERRRAELEAAGKLVVSVDGDGERISEQSEQRLDGEVWPESLAYIIYTSGSTGKPKGVAIRHKSAAAFTNWCREVFTQEDMQGVLASTSICFDLSVFEILVTLACGGRLILAQDTLRLAELEAAREVRLINTVPSAIAELVRMGNLPESVKIVNLAGEALARAVVDEVYKRGSVERVYNLYGPSEDTTYSTYTEVERGKQGAPTIGRPITNTKVYILDQWLQPAPAGVAGELYIAGDGLARGYWNRPDQTAEKFIPNPFSAGGGERLYRTGDLARYLLDGQIDYIARADNQVKIRGYRIELGEIESVLRQLQAIKDVVVVVREDEPGDKRLVAYLTPAGQFEAPNDELRSYLQDKLPDYMRPAAFVWLQQMPLTRNGKIDRKALPAPTYPITQSGSGEPLTPVEEIIINIWASLLKQERISVDDNFFDLGGHSLLATLLISKLRSVFDVELPLQMIFEAPTVKELAAGVQQKKRIGLSAGSAPITPADRNQPAPLSYAQQRLWFIDQLEPESEAYNLPTATRLTGNLNFIALEQSFNEVVRRHETLRTTFQSQGERPVQVIGAAEPASLSVIDLSGLSQDQREFMARQLATEESRRPFDLTRGPLLRVRVMRLSEADHVLTLALHHIITDGWSIGVLVNEVKTFYGAYANGQVSALPELKIQYADYAAWQREWLRGEVLEEGLSYWRRELSEKLPALNLSVDRPRSTASFKGANQTHLMSKELRDRVRNLSREEGVTTYMALLTAFSVLLYRRTGQPEMILGMTVAGRTSAEIEGMIGMFINMLPVRIDLKGGPSYREALSKVRDTAIRAHAHQDTPIEKIVEELELERIDGQAALIQVAFGMQNTPQVEAELPGLGVAPFAFENEAARFDLTVWVTETAEGLEVDWKYRADLFDHNTIATMSQQFEHLLLGITEDSAARLNTIEILTEVERTRQSSAEEEWDDMSAKRLVAVKRKPMAAPAD